MNWFILAPKATLKLKLNTRALKIKLKMFGNFGYDLHYKDDSDFYLLFSSEACSLWTLKRNKKKIYPSSCFNS